MRHPARRKAAPRVAPADQRAAHRRTTRRCGQDAAEEADGQALEAQIREEGREGGACREGIEAADHPRILVRVFAERSRTKRTSAQIATNHLNYELSTTERMRFEKTYAGLL